MGPTERYRAALIRLSLGTDCLKIVAWSVEKHDNKPVRLSIDLSLVFDSIHLIVFNTLYDLQAITLMSIQLPLMTVSKSSNAWQPLLLLEQIKIQ